MTDHICSIFEDGARCTRPTYARTWCATHYRRFLVHGDPYHRRQYSGPSECQRPECERPVKARGLCSLHDHRRKRGLPLDGVPASKYTPLADRFWAKVAVGEPEDCWEWQACRRPAGYGQLMVNKRPVGAHRISYQLAHPGEDIDGLLIRHKCDNPPCVNPAHLEPGTYQDNADDRVARAHR
jgi:HNH endonuclease